MEIQFLNHASVKIKTGDAVILTDPWLKGASFNEGWDLLVRSPDVESAALEEITHIWISHEHPDHFSVPFFLSFPQELKSRVEILFQDTKDKRVAGFLRKQGFSVRELKNHKPHRIGQTELCVGKSAFYDSYLYLKDGETSLLNLNDCPIADSSTLKRIRSRFGAPTVLLTQFSYAAWKGGKENKPFRELLARRKLSTIRRQAECLGPRYLIPFASFVYFSNEENFYMNDSINTIDTVFEELSDLKAQLITLEPKQRWTVGAAHDNEKPRSFWRERYSQVESMPRRAPGDSADGAVLQEAFAAYKARVLKKNNAFLIRLARRVPGLGAFQPINVRLRDLAGGHGETWRLDFDAGLNRVSDEPHDVEMHSSSLLFIFKNEFGYDTLTVNARFEATPDGFSKMTKFLAIGSLNAMGLSLSFGILLHLSAVWRLLTLLNAVRKGLEI